jgi:hypothetical protein
MKIFAMIVALIVVFYWVVFPITLRFLMSYGYIAE